MCGPSCAQLSEGQIAGLLQPGPQRRLHPDQPCTPVAPNRQTAPLSRRREPVPHLRHPDLADFKSVCNGWADAPHVPMLSTHGPVDPVNRRPSCGLHHEHTEGHSTECIPCNQNCSSRSPHRWCALLRCSRGRPRERREEFQSENTAYVRIRHRVGVTTKQRRPACFLTLTRDFTSRSVSDNVVLDPYLNSD